MGINCSSLNENNSIIFEKDQSIGSIKFNTISYEKNESFNQILENINYCKTENSPNYLNLKNINIINSNNNKISITENINNDILNQIVKNDKENSFNIADDIRSNHSSNSLIEHGAVLNDNNSFFNNEDILYATEKLIEYEINEKKKENDIIKNQFLEKNKNKNIINNDNNNNNNEIKLINNEEFENFNYNKIKTATALGLNIDLFNNNENIITDKKKI